MKICTAKILFFTDICKYFRASIPLTGTYGNLMPLMATFSYITFGGFAEFLYLCTMETTSRTYGRMELAQAYFPAITPRAAWKKLKSLLADIPSVSHLATLSRRSFLPAEVNAIFTALGRP